MRRPGPVAEALLALAVTLPFAIGLSLPTLWFLVPFTIITVTGRPYEDYGLTWRNPGSPAFHAVTSLVIFGGYALLHYAFARIALDRHFELTLPPDLLDTIVTQFIVIGLSEEFFFRGYLQTHLNRRFERRFELFGARFGWGLILAALLFGLCHIVTGDLTRMRTMFFGLFAGWLRERTDTIAVPAAYHGFANVLYEIMARSMRA
jgi:membrane protease YdiL (CAAX protease family)